MAIAYVNSLKATPGINGGATGALDTTSMTLIVVGIAAYAATTLSDSQGNTWTLLHSQTQGSVTMSWYYCIDPTVNASHTFTVSGTGIYPGIVVSGYSGTDIAFDKKAVAGAAATSVATGSVTPANDNSLVVTVQGKDTPGETQSISASMTKRQEAQYVGGTNGGCAIADIVQTTATAINPSWSSASSTDRAAGVAVFYETPPITTKTPLIIDEGVIQQLQSGDVLTDVVYAASDFGTDELVIVSDGTGKDVKASTVSATDLAALSTVVTAASAFATDNVLLRSDGTGRGSQLSNAVLADGGKLTLTDTAIVDVVPKVCIQVNDNTAATALEISVSDAANANIFIGIDQGTGTTTGNVNTGIGYQAGKALTSGSTNMIIGAFAGLVLSSGSTNTCIGASAGRAITTVNNCTFVGASAGRNTTGASNLAIGTSAGINATTGTFNTIVGTSAVSSLTYTGSTSVFVGAQAGLSMTGGSTNTFIGTNAGNNGSQLATATNSTAIGNSSFTTASNQVVIGNTSITQTILRGSATITCSALTTTNGLNLSDLDALTTGSGLNIVSNSSSTGTRNLAFIHNDHASATGTTALRVRQDSTGTVIAAESGTTNVMRVAPTNFSHGSGNFTATDDARSLNYVIRNQTTDATQSTLFLDGSSVGLTMPQNSCWHLTAKIVGLKTDGSVGGAYTISASARRDGAGSATLIGAVTTSFTREDDAAWDATVDVSSNDMRVRVTGVAATTINWVAKVEVVQVIVQS